VTAHHRWPIRVYYEDVDLAGIVYHANYLRFIERARSEMIRAAGIDQAALRAEGLVFAVARIEAEYLRPARYDDPLVVETMLASRGKVRCVMGQTILRDAAPLFRAAVTVVCMTPDGRPRRLPAAMATLPLEGGHRVGGVGSLRGLTLAALLAMGMDVADLRFAAEEVVGGVAVDQDRGDDGDGRDPPNSVDIAELGMVLRIGDVEDRSHAANAEERHGATLEPTAIVTDQADQSADRAHQQNQR
jgi:acyl-CoA thioester hydrolase